MSVSTEQSSFILPDFTSTEFHAVDLPLSIEKRRVTDHVYSSASFTSWRNADSSLRDQATDSMLDSHEGCCENEQPSLEACDSAFWQGRVKSAQIASIKERGNQSREEEEEEEEEEGLTFPTNEMTISSPLISPSPSTEDEKLIAEHNPSRKSLYRSSIGMGTSKAVTDGWIRVEFWVLDDHEIEIELAFIDEASRQFYIMEKEREEQFYIRNEEVFQRVSRTAEQDSSTDSEDEFEGIPNSNEYNVFERRASSTRSALTQLRDKRILRLTKSVSMTTLIRCEATESVMSAEEDPPVRKTVQRVLPTDFGFSSVACAAGDTSSAWSTTTPKLRRNLNKQIKRKWQPVSRFVVRRCHAWDGGSSSGDGYSSKGCSFSLRRILHRIMCCGRALSSDDDDDEISR